jgi:hypothetical protein
MTDNELCTICSVKGHGPAVDGECQLAIKQRLSKSREERIRAERQRVLDEERQRFKEYAAPLFDRIYSLEQRVAILESVPTPMSCINKTP